MDSGVRIMTAQPAIAVPPLAESDPASIVFDTPTGYPLTLRSNGAQLAGELAFPAASAPPLGLAVVVQPASLHDAGPYAIGQALLAAGYAVFRIDLLTPNDTRYPDLLRDVALLESRLASCLQYLQGNDCRILGLPSGLGLGIVASGGAAPAALRLIASRQGACRVLACRNGFIDQAGRHALGYLSVPLLYVGEEHARHGDSEALPSTETSAAQHALTLINAPHDLIVSQRRQDTAQAVTAWLRRWLHP